VIDKDRFYGLDKISQVAAKLEKMGLRKKK
jgi:hypothetical protein